MTNREILITNDDGIESKGLLFLADVMSAYGNVSVVAPETVQSGKSASLSLGQRLDLKRIGKARPYALYSFSGTPVDCVKIAINEIYRRKCPDLLVSGINHGSNASVASVYSGTLGAAAEGTIYGIPSIGFSLDTHLPDPDFTQAEPYIKKITEKYLSFPVRKGVYLNVNLPYLPEGGIKGIRIAHRGFGRWIREFETRQDEKGKDYFWMVGTFQDLDDGSGDHSLLNAGYVTIVPHNIDNTDYAEISRLEQIWSDLV